MTSIVATAASTLRKAAGYIVVAAITAFVVAAIYAMRQPQENGSVSLNQLLESMIVESENERAALQMILTGDPDKIEQGRSILEDAALSARPTAQRHLATYWALSDAEDKRARVYQWLLVALACARGIDRQAESDAQINYLLFLTNIALIEHSTSPADKELGTRWAKSWFAANSDVAALTMCDVAAIDDYQVE